MEQAVSKDTSTEQESHANVSIVLRTTVNLCDDDLSEEAKRQFPYHKEILQAYQMNERNSLSNDRLSPVGRHLVCLTLETYYAKCKNVLNYVATHPEQKSSTDLIHAPIIICGLPRTGTTLLYNLLACDRRCRAPLFTDIMEPVPPLARSDVIKQMQRNEIVSAQRNMFTALGLTKYDEDIRASHPSLAYDEDQYILGQAGLYWLNYLLVPHRDNELVKWFLDTSGKDFAYEFHKTFIKMLNSVDAPQSHWLLKTPVHLLFLDALLRHYPKASLIMTHRGLNEVLPSCVRLAVVYTSAFFNSIKPDVEANEKTVVELILHLMDDLIRKLVQFRRTNHKTRVLDIIYEDLLAKPIDTIRHIYDYFGLTWSQDFELAMLAWLRDNPQGKQGRNTYTLEAYGLDREEIEKSYEEYYSMFLKNQK